MLLSGSGEETPVDRTFARVLVVAVSALAVAGAACTEGGGSEADPGGTPSGSRSEDPETVTPIPEGQSLMDPGSYLAQTEPAITLTTTTPWYGAANVPRFVVFGQLDHFPYAELYLLNLEQVVRNPGDPGDPWKLRQPPDDLLGWLVDHVGMEVVGEVAPVEIGGFPGRQADLRVPSDAVCAPEHTRPFPEACLLFFTLPGEPEVFPFAKGMAYRITVLPDVAGETVTLLYTDYAQRFDDRIEPADEVVRSIEFDV
jgi:hypothetical protein